MAQGAAVSFLLETIRDLVIHEAKFLGEVKSQVKQLQVELEFMQSLLIEAEAKSDKQEFVRKWVAKFKEVAYDVEDLLESYAFKIGSRQHGGSGITRPARRFISCMSALQQTHKFGSQIEPLMAEIINHKASLEGYARTIDIVAGGQVAGSTKMKIQRTYSLVVEKDFVGLESNVEELVEHLVGERYQVVSIWGMGGLGKTTLAQKIYSHQIVRDHFKSPAWVCVSKDDWTASGILKTILLKIGGIDMKQMEQMNRMLENDELVRELVRKLYDAQSGSRYLVVLDDIWGIDAWELIKPAFRTSTKVLLTTRNEKVGLQIDPRCLLHKPRLLNDEESWKLLQKKAFLGSDLDEDFMGNKEDKKALGWKMIKHCDGLPLAVIVLGGVLATKQSLDEWKAVDKDIKYHLGKKTSEIMQEDPVKAKALNEILSLSYDNLPYRLKACFLYMAGFPEDESIDVERLYNLWMAEGLVSMADRIGDDEMFICIAERYLGELAQRSMVQVTSRNFSSILKFDSCRLHDIMRDLSLKKAREENFLHVVDESTSYPSSSTCKVRRVRVSINCASNDNQPWPLRERMWNNTRSLQLCFKDKDGRSRWTETDLNDFQLLRSLVIERRIADYGRWTDYCYPTKSIRNLSHLRYLCANGNGDSKISLTSLSKLEHLQTLDLRGIYTWKTTSTVLKNQTKLKDLHLPSGEVQCGYGLPKEMLRFDSLRELERLSNFNPNYCEVKDLSKLTKLREVLIKLKDNGVNCIEDVINNLNKLKFLDHLYLQIWGRPSFQENKVLLSNIHKSLDEDSSSTFLRALKGLELAYVEVDGDFVEALEKLPNLRQLELIECRGISELICHSNGFPQLKFLELKGLDMEEWRVDEGGMPNLSHLQVFRCDDLMMFPEGLIKSLKEINFDWMPEEFRNYVESVSGQQGANFKVSNEWS